MKNISKEFFNLRMLYRIIPGVAIAYILTTDTTAPTVDPWWAISWGVVFCWVFVEIFIFKIFNDIF